MLSFADILGVAVHQTEQILPKPTRFWGRDAFTPESWTKSSAPSYQASTEEPSSVSSLCPALNPTASFNCLVIVWLLHHPRATKAGNLAELVQQDCGWCGVRSHQLWTALGEAAAVRGLC